MKQVINNGLSIGEDHIRIYRDGKEIVGWHETEWIQDETVVISIANAISLYYEGKLMQVLNEK